MIDAADIARMRDLGDGRQRAAGLRRRLGRGRRHVRRAARAPSGRWRPTRSPTFADAGVALALGSDAPVTPLDPWGGVHAAVDHRTPGSGLRPFDAFDAATHGGWYAARAEHAGRPARRRRARRTSRCGRPPDTLSAVLADRAPARLPRCLARRAANPVGDRPHERRSTSTRRSSPGRGSWPPGPRSRWSTWPHRHTTVSVERAVLRLAGLTGTDPVTGEGRTEDRVPWVNRVVDAVREPGRPGVTASRCRSGTRSPPARHRTCTPLAEQVGAGTARFALPDRRRRRPGPATPRAPPSAAGIARIDANRRPPRASWSPRHGDPPRRPWIYLIVATGDIYEDIPQAQAAARAGADVIAVIRSTGQSLLDYVPEGATRTGYAGTYATQENFRLMRAALDDVSAELGRYVRLTNYASGPVHARDRRPGRPRAAGHDAQRRDVRDPLPRHQPAPHLRRPALQPAWCTPAPGSSSTPARTTTSPPPTPSTRRTPSRSASCSTRRSPRRPASRTGSSASGHAFEINPDLPESFRLELAHALLARELFPDAPLKWMPPTKHMTGDVFRGYLLDGFFNLAGALTGQGILLVGMMTEAVVTPWLSDRDLALRNVRYVLDAAGNLAEDFAPAAGRLHRPPGRHRAPRGGRPARPDRRPPRGPDPGDRRRHVRHHQAARRTAARAWTASSSSAADAYNPALELLEREAVHA